MGVCFLGSQRKGWCRSCLLMTPELAGFSWVAGVGLVGWDGE